jgi:hypothetical protein
MALRLRRGPESDRLLITPLQGEIVYVTDTKKIYSGDGVTVGGVLVGPTLLEESNPQLGGDLNLNGNNITGTGNINITGNITATGNINLGDNAADNISVLGLINSTLTPAIDDSYNLGTSAKQWANVWATQANIDTTLAVGSQIIKLSGGTGDSSLVLWDAETDTVTATNIVGNLSGSVFSDDSLKLVDGNNGSLHTSLLSLSGDDIISASPFVNIGSNANPVSVNLYQENNSSFISLTGTINPIDEIQPWINMSVSRNTNLDPSAVVSGDVLSGILVFGYDGTNYNRAIALAGRADPGAPVVSGRVPGEFIAVVQSTTAGFDGESDSHVLSFNSKGRLSVPVIKTGVYDDATARDAFVATPEKGMIIFNDGTNKFQGYDGSAWVDLN